MPAGEEFSIKLIVSSSPSWRTDISSQYRVRCGHMEVAIEQVESYRQAMPPGRGCSSNTALAAFANAVPLHQPLHPQFIPTAS
jgi:hypothetical protein